MRFGQLMQLHRENSELLVTKAHAQWLKDNPDPRYSDEAKRFLAREAGKPQRDRARSFGASNLGGCPRAAQFQYLGIPEKQITDERTISIFHNGTHMHLRWQLAGLTAGWLKEAEVFKTNEELMLKGTLDGVLTNGNGLELKSINSHGYTKVLQYGAKKEHLAQIDGYFLLAPEIDVFHLIYENKDTQDFKEIVVKRDPERVKKAKERLLVMVGKTLSGEYFDIKDECWEEKGSFRYCPFSPICKDAGESFS